VGQAGPHPDFLVFGANSAAASGGLGFVYRVALFDGHVFEFTGFEDVTAFETLNKF